MVEEPSLDPRELLAELSKSFCSISSALSCISDAIVELERTEESYDLEFDDRGVFLGQRSRLSPEHFIPDENYRAEEVKGNCEWLPKWVDKLREAHKRTDEALIALPTEVAQLLSDHVDRPWCPMVRQECLNIILLWPGEVLHTFVAKKVCTRVPDLLKLASEHPPYEKWKYFCERLDVYRSHILAIGIEKGRLATSEIEIETKETKDKPAYPNRAKPDGAETVTNGKAILAGCINSIRNAYLSFKYAERQNEKQLEDRPAYDWLKEHGCDDAEGLVDYCLPAFETWSRYLRDVRRKLGEQKYQPRAGRATGGSVARVSDL